MTEKTKTNEVQNKVIRLFTYLEKALSLDDSVTRDFKTIIAPPSPWWVADLPTDVESLSIKKFDTEEAIIEDELGDNVWLRVEKKSIKAAPVLPKSLNEWISDINPIAIPIAKEKIGWKIKFDQDPVRVGDFKKFRKDFSQGDTVPENLKDWVIVTPGKLPEVIEEKYEEDFFVNHPELQKLLDGYIENEWKPWAEKVVQVYKANKLYDELYALRLLLKNEGDNYELLWGHGLLTWKHRGVGTIYAPIFLTPLVLDFDASKGIIEISPDPMFRGFVEISSLYEMNNPAEMDLITWCDKINADPFNFWHFESLKAQARTLINYVSSENEDVFDKTIISNPEASNLPSVWNAPVVFARKRNNDLWSKYAGTIRRDVEQNCIEVTDFIADLVGVYSDTKPGIADMETGVEKNPDVSLQESELFFPLPWNDEQKRIAERIEANYGVVVKGPPGTGKSHTIANLISRFLSQGKTVLVTSQSSKALEVLREKLPENIRSLAVSQLNQTAKRDDVLQQSITEISSNLGERQTKFSEHRVEMVRKELKEVREQKASLANEIKKYILSDSQDSVSIDGDNIKPIDAAKLISKYQNNTDFDWFTDRVSYNTELNFNENDLNNLYVLARELDEKAQSLYEFELPSKDRLPDQEQLIGAFASYRELSAKAKLSPNTFDETNPNFSKEVLLTISDKLNQARKTLFSFNKPHEKELFSLCAKSSNEREKWQIVMTKISEKIEVITKNNNSLIGNEISGESDLTLNEIIDAIEVLRNKVGDGAKIGTFGKMLLSTNAKKILETFKINNRPVDNLERLNVLKNNFLVKQAYKDISLILTQSFNGFESKPEGLLKNEVDLIEIEVLLSEIKKIVSYPNDFSSVQDFCKKVLDFPGLWQGHELNYFDIQDLDKLSEVIESRLAGFGVIELETIFSSWIQVLKYSTTVKTHPVVHKLIENIQKKNTTGYKAACEELDSLIDNKEKSVQLEGLRQKISGTAPNLCKDIFELAKHKEKFECPKNLALVWKIARLQTWLDDIHDHTDIDELQAKLERLTKKEYELNGDLVTILAWQRQIDRVTKKQRDALMAWSHQMKQYGKGTGKYAVTHLRAAQEALKEAKNAVPVWIMPLHKAAQMFSEPKAGMFDVVIFDEASQCDIKGITIGYLGKKLLVVGDPEQISPAGIFQNQEKIFELISRYLSDIDFKDSFSITSSLFDLAKIRLSNIVQLNEHFRCVPEIIAFSNHHIYEGKLKPLRHPHPKGQLKPALVPVFIENGYQNKNNKVNEPEAQAIVSKLVECLKDPAYQKRPDGRLCTFGIISLLAEDQVKFIKELILKHPDIGIKNIEERKITVGDAYEFQGDERDVIFLSMVRALDANNPDDTIKPLADEGAKRRFNVAASRARDQMFLFHSMPKEALTSHADWRYKLLNWFYDPMKEELKAGRESLKKEFDAGRASEFSLEVGNLIIDKGYQVIPEYPVIGRRIDLVIQGENARLAVECDGDQYHTLEKWEEDQARERQLRRAGWIFWRLTGSAFYRHKENALESLWKKLDELGIKPII